MRIKLYLICTLSSCLIASVAQPALGQLYTEDFDDGNASTRWTVNTTGIGLVDPAGGVEGPMDTNFDLDADGIVDDTSGFAFDYSSVGIPSAPSSSGGSTIGMKLQANLFSDAFGGFSVSPNSASVTGDFRMSFDFWGNAHTSPAGDGTSNLSYFGFGTTGTFANSPGTSDGIWFAAVADGDSGSDYRVYDHDERQFSYQIPGANAYESAIDDFATYPLDLFGEPTRDSDSSPLLQANFGGETPPAAMQAAFPSNSLSSPSFAGSLGFAWREMEIIKEGNTARWVVDGVEIISLDMSNLPPLHGENILFGNADINTGSPADFNAQFLLFTLIDNIEVTSLSAPEDADFDGDEDIDGADFLAWQRGFGIDDGTALPANGDANGDGNVDAADIAIWEGQFGTAAGLSVAQSVPEPSALGFAGLALFFIVSTTSPHRHSPLQRA